MSDKKIISRSSYFIPGLIATLLLSTIVASSILAGEAFAQAPMTTTPTITTGTFNPPPGYNQVRQNPAFAVHIRFSDLGFSPFDPRSISIPVGMTVIWFNDDQSMHSVTMNTTSSNVTSPADTFDSGLIVPGGSFMHQFTSPGTYVYYDNQNPAAKGSVKVGNQFETGNNMDMLVGGNALPFNSSKLSSMTLTFVPHASAAKIPPNLSITFGVTIANSTQTLFTHQFEDSDGILDLELVPTSKSNFTQHFTTWGPDLLNNEAVASDGTYHVQGPVLVDNSLYTIRVSIIAISRTLLPSPITDTFVLPPVGAL